MSKKDDRTHCECVCDCGSTQYGAIDFYNKNKTTRKELQKCNTEQEEAIVYQKVDTNLNFVDREKKRWNSSGKRTKIF